MWIKMVKMDFIYQNKITYSLRKQKQIKVTNLVLIYCLEHKNVTTTQGQTNQTKNFNLA